MADVTITGLPTAATIDPIVDWIPIDTTSLATTQKINRNTYLGITGSPVGTTDTQAVTNKTIGNTNTVTLKDTLFTLQDDSDTTKQAKFQLSSITTGTTRTYTLPNASSTIADTSTAQAFTNKTLTSPTITGGSIDNSTITVDSIAGHTSASIVTVAGLQISSGVLNTNNSVVTANIADSAITPAKLQSGTGSSWAWQTWVPTWTNLTVGNGVVVARYTRIGKTVHFNLSFTFGTTSVIGSSPTVTLPTTVSSNYTADSINGAYIGQINYLDANTSIYSGAARLNTTSTVALVVLGAASTYVNQPANVSATVPHTWGTSDAIFYTGTYESI